MKITSSIILILLANVSNAIAETPGFIHTNMTPGIITLFIMAGLIILVVGLITDATIDGTPIWLAGAVPFGFGIYNSLLTENPLNEGLFSSYAVKATMIILAAIIARIIKRFLRHRAQGSVSNYQY